MSKDVTNIPGTFVVIEGIDGAGTTTQAKMLVDWVIQQGKKSIYTCEPSNGPVGLLLRQILSGRTLARTSDGIVRPISNDAIALLFAADRLDHLDCEILPLLCKGVQIISDRYYYSSLTYQSIEGDLTWISALNSRARSPDITYILDVPAEVAAERRTKTRESLELYDHLEFQRKLESAYRHLPELLPSEVIVFIDGTLEPHQVHQNIIQDIGKRLSWLALE